MKNLTVLLLGLICILFATSSPAQVPSDQARNYQINETHTGTANTPGLTPPLKQKWNVNFGQPISYPLIADGKVFVTVSNAGAPGTKLYALNAADGTTVWSYALGGTYSKQTTYYKLDGGTTKTYTAPFNVSGNGSHTVNLWSVDKATNTESMGSVVIKIDTSKPTVTSSATPASALKSSNPVTVTVSGHVTDTISGVPAGGATYYVVDEYGITQPSGPVVLQANGNYSFTLSLPATRNNGDSYHLYTITVQAFDQAGNTASASDTVRIN